MDRKHHKSAVEALQSIPNGAVVFIGGFGSAGVPYDLVRGLCDMDLRDLTIVSNNPGTGGWGIAELFVRNVVRKLICSFPKLAGADAFAKAYGSGRVELEIVPQGTLAERIRAGGSGLGGVLTRTALGTELSDRSRVVIVDGVQYLLERPLRADVALVKVSTIDRWGNADYHGTARNFNPVMATAADLVVAEANSLSDGSLDPDRVVTPGLLIDRFILSSGPPQPLLDSAAAAMQHSGG